MLFGIGVRRNRGVLGTARTLIEHSQPPLWTGVLLLALSIAALAWAMIRARADTKTQRPAIPRRPFKNAQRLWTWSNYPFLIAFTGLMIAEDVLGQFHSLGPTLLIVVLSMSPLGVWAYMLRRHDKKTMTTDTTASENEPTAQ